MTAGVSPLDGLRILAATQLGAGPFGMMFLSDLGAEVIKIEDPATAGDEARRVPPFADADARDGLYYQSFNRGTRSLTLNLRHPEGQRLLHRLAARVDAVYNNLRGDLPATLGLDYAALRDANPRLVCCSLTGFGRTGPRRGEPAYDYLLQAYAGFMSVTGEPDAPPTKCGISIVDFSGGILSALALMIGLHRSRATGEGGDVDVSLLDTALSMLNYMAIWALNRDWQPARHAQGAHQSLVPSQTFRTADGWLVIMVMKEKFWTRLVECLERAGAGSRPALSHLRRPPRPSRRARSRAGGRCSGGARPPSGSRGCAATCRSRRSTRSTRRWRTSRRWRARWSSRSMHPVFGTLREVGCPIKIDGVTPRYAPGAALGADTAALLAEVGVDVGELPALRAAGVI